MSPSNFALTNPAGAQAHHGDPGRELAQGSRQHARRHRGGPADADQPGAFEVGRNLAITPGKVINETPLYQLIQYTPTTDEVLETPLVIFPPWINRFYILDLTPEKSFVKWCVDQGISLFMVSWKSADESLADADARRLCPQRADRCDRHHPRPAGSRERSMPSAIALQARRSPRRWPIFTPRSRQAKVAVGNLPDRAGRFLRGGRSQAVHRRRDHRRCSQQLTTRQGLSRRPLHGRDLQPAARSRSHLELCGQQLFARARSRRRSTCCTGTRTPPTCRPSWHRDYLETLYKGNKLVQRGAIKVAGTPIDFGSVKTPTFVQAGREDHIAPPESVWKIMDHFAGPTSASCSPDRAISPASSTRRQRSKYQYWINDKPRETLEAFIDGADRA